MSRFYLFRLTPPAQSGSKTVSVTIDGISSSETGATPTANAQNPKEWTSHPNGVYDPAAHNVIFDFMVVDYAQYAGSMTFTIEGVSITDLIQANNYTPKPGMNSNLLQYWNYQLYLGMAPDGLPLSTPQAGQPSPGLVAAGSIQESFGNWVGNDMSLSFLLMNTGLQVSGPVLNWLPGQPLASALQTMLGAAFPGVPQKISISPSLVGPMYGVYMTTNSLQSMAHFIQTQTRGTNYGQAQTYPGVSIYIQNGVLIATDSTQTPTKPPIQISLESFIGQPVWVGGDVIAFNLVMRADIQVGDQLQLPKDYQQLPGFAATLAQVTNYGFNFKLAFAGTFWVKSVRYIGESRSDSGAEWMTIVEAIPLTQTPSTAPS